MPLRAPGDKQSEFAGFPSILLIQNTQLIDNYFVCNGPEALKEPKVMPSGIARERFSSVQWRFWG